ncbi:Uncharacterised protein [uncultured archaeon]|nr:Uncharacterised protein [uncultured archaeon]
MRRRTALLKNNSNGPPPLLLAFADKPQLEKIKQIDRVRRVQNGASYRAAGEGAYSITKNGGKVLINSHVEKDSGGGFSVLLSTEKQTTPIARFIITKSTSPPGWNMLWRRVQPDYRGYNLGKLGFRLAEQEVRRQGGRRMIFYTGRVDALRTALSMGYAPATEQGEKTIMNLAGISKKDALPNGSVVAKKLQEASTETFQGIFLVRELEK